MAGCACWEVTCSRLAPSQVFRVVRAGAPTLYLKIGPHLRPERDRLRWLEHRLPVPRVVAYAEAGERAFLVLTAVPGVPADSDLWLPRAQQLVESLAEGMRAVHAVPIDDCPFDASIDMLLSKAEQAIRQGLLRQEELSHVYRNLTVDDLFARLVRLRPRASPQAFTHGDYCLPNILVHLDGAVGFVDVGLAGVGDAYRDMALAARSIRENLGERWVEKFFRACGQEVEADKLEFYTILDEFLMARGYHAGAPG